MFPFCRETRLCTRNYALITFIFERGERGNGANPEEVVGVPLRWTKHSAARRRRPVVLNIRSWPQLFLPSPRTWTQSKTVSLWLLCCVTWYLQRERIETAYLDSLRQFNRHIASLTPRVPANSMRKTSRPCVLINHFIPKSWVLNWFNTSLYWLLPRWDSAIIKFIIVSTVTCQNT